MLQTIRIADGYVSFGSDIIPNETSSSNNDDIYMQSLNLNNIIIPDNTNALMINNVFFNSLVLGNNSKLLIFD